MLLNPLTFHTPKTISELNKLLLELENVKLQAGGTFLLNALKLLKKKGARTPDHIVSLQKIEELKGISDKGDHLIIKSMTTIDDIFHSPLLKDQLQILKTVCQNISTQPIRNMATVGGNLTCRYTWTEMPAVMIGLQAKMHFIDQDGQTHIVPPETFFKNNAKTEHILTHISIPKNTDRRLSYRRVKKTPYVDIPLLSILINTNLKDNQFSDTIVAINNCVSFAQRDTTLEDFLNEQTISEKVGQEALDHLDNSIYDKRSNEYKKYIFRVSLQEAIEELSS